MANIRNPIPKRLKEARIAFGLSQKKLGMLAGIDEFSASARMNQYETGKHIPDYLTLKRIATILLVPVSFFYAEDDTLASAITIFCKLNKTVRKKIVEIMQRELEKP